MKAIEYCSPHGSRNMIDDVDVLHQKCTIIRVNSQARQHAVSIDGDNFMSKFGINLFRNFKQLQ